MLCRLRTLFAVCAFASFATCTARCEESPAPTPPKAEQPAPVPTAGTPEAAKPETKPAAEPNVPAAAAAEPKPAEDVIKFTNDPDAPPPADIFAATKGGDLEAVKKFIARDPALISARSKVLDTALHWAASCNHTDIVKFLIEKGSDPNAKNISGATPLHLAARKAYTGPMEALISAKAEINAKNDDGEETPLHIAVQKGDVAAIELLLKNGADPNARMTDGTRPMDIAEKKEKSEVRKIMTKYKAISTANEQE